MSRRALALGEHGEVEATPQRRDGTGKWKRAGAVRQAQRWRARCYVRGFDGVIRDLSRVGGTKRLAVQALAAALVELRSAGDGSFTASTSLLRAGELWLTQIRRTDSGLSERTVLDYSRTFARYVDANGSSIRGLTLGQANDPQRLRGFLQAIADRHGTGAAKMCRSVLAGILGHAVSSGVLASSAMRQVRPVRSQTPRDTQRDTRRAFTRAEREAVIDHADKLAAQESLNPRTIRKRQTTADLVAFMAGTGVRIGEARAIRWEHVNLDAATVDVYGTKSTSARRRLSLPSWLCRRLSARTERLGAEGLVFSSPAHLDDAQRPWDQSNSSRAVAGVLRGAGMPWATPHTFRRTVASMLGDAGLPLARVADQLGHANADMTARVYLGRDFLGDKSALAEHL